MHLFSLGIPYPSSSPIFVFIFISRNYPLENQYFSTTVRFEQYLKRWKKNSRGEFLLFLKLSLGCNTIFHKKNSCIRPYRLRVEATYNVSQNSLQLHETSKNITWQNIFRHMVHGMGLVLCFFCVMCKYKCLSKDVEGLFSK